MDSSDKIFVAGHRGLVGSAIVRALEAQGYRNLVLRTHKELDLEDQASVRRLFDTERPTHVLMAAARVGGILANDSYRAEFIYNNLVIQCNVIDAAWRSGVRRLLFLGSSCIYPRDCPQPMKEEYLLTGPLEHTNEPYAVAKIAGVKMCEAYNSQYGTSFVSVMPTNLYGPNDNFDLASSHVLPALLRKVHEAKMSGAKKFTVWGSGTPKREFLHVDDMALACIHVLKREDFTDMVNIGSGEEISIRQLAELISDVVGFSGSLEFDTSKPDGTPRKLLDIQRLRAMGWRPAISLHEGIRRTYEWFLQSHYAMESGRQPSLKRLM
jgi:GDP-L-fucose synthase